jgi:vacuolar-type H+-ATPase subunit I/STV1
VADELRDTAQSAARASNDDWARQIVDGLDSVVDAVRSKTSDPLAKLIKAVVFGVMAAGLGFMTLLLLTIGSIRMLDAYLPSTVWAAYLVLGGLFCLIGVLLWSKRRPVRR